MILRDGYHHGRHLGLHQCGTCLAPVLVVRVARNPTAVLGRGYRIVMLEPGDGTTAEHCWQLADNTWDAHRADSGRARMRAHYCPSTAIVVQNITDRYQVTGDRRQRIAQAASM